MGAQAVDYRVSTLIVLCKDCGQDVGLYPARHKCGPIERPAMPALPTQYQKSPPPSSLQLNSRTISSGSASSTSSSTSPSFTSVEQTSSKWSSRLAKTSATQKDEKPENEDSIYFNNFASNLPDNHDQPVTGKKLWGKVKQNEKWKQLSEKNEKPKQSGKLWGKLMQATQNMADKIPSRDDRGADSDEDDWEGETHVSRILREYYEKKRLRLPEWLFDGDTPMVSRKKSVAKSDTSFESNNNGPVRTPSRRRLWEQSPTDAKNISSRERERQELRQVQPPPPPVPSNARDDRYHEDDHYNGGRHNDSRYHDNRYSNRENTNYRDQRSNSTDRYNTSPVDNHYEQIPPPSSSRQHSYEQPPSSSRQYSYEQPPSSSRQYSYEQPPSSSRQYSYEQPPKSTSRPRYYDNEEPPAPRSERSARGYQQRDPPPQRVTANHQQYDRGNDLDDYYYKKDSTRDRNPPPRREPSIRSGGRRYGNDPSYF